jgi:hypothetical protein
MIDYMKRDNISIKLERKADGLTTLLTITADYIRSPRKSRLQVNDEIIKNDVLRVWKSIKTSKLKSLVVFFDEIDWYDNMTDIYNTPVVIMQRGEKLPVSFPRSHGSIPKEWSFNVLIELENVKQKNVIFDILKTLLCFVFDEKVKKEFLVELKPFLKGESGRICYYLNEEN